MLDYPQMTSATVMEINEVRPFFSKAMETLIQIKIENMDMTQRMDDDYA